jgi:Flp pilus assembly protein TadG
MPQPFDLTRHALRRFRRNRRGSAAVEFALVAPIFFGLLFAIIEVAMVFFASQVLETVTQDAARMIMTGQAQNLVYTRQQFKDYVCDPTRFANVLFDCTNGIYIDVQNYPAFANVAITDPIVAGSFVNNMKYCPGQDGDIVVVRMFYQWQLFVTGLGFNIANLAGGKRLLSATAAFKNEPFPSPPPPCS